MKVLRLFSKGYVRRGGVFFAAFCVALAGFVLMQRAALAEDAPASRLMTVYDRGTTISFLTEAKTISEALEQADIDLDVRDTVEPARDETLVATEYYVNIYRARPVIVNDGNTRVKVMTPFQTAARIAQDANISLYPEDGAEVSRSEEFIGDGAGLQLTITRAVPFVLDLYGSKNETRTRSETVGDMLREKGITLGEIDHVSVLLDTPITVNMQVRVWREGIQTISVEQQTGFPTEIIYDADRPLGYRAISTPGVSGVQTVSYEVEIKNGVEVRRTELARIQTKQPRKQVLAIGIKGLENGLTKAKGAHYFTDSRGISHRETYYDLNMSVVMQSCGQGGRYTVRFDGMKIDSDGYVIIAANYSRYPKCSVVETSVGPGKVYDTGGFAVRHPEGFDLATDWSRADGI